MDVKITPDKLFEMLGRKTVENEALCERIRVLEFANAELSQELSKSKEAAEEAAE